MSSICSADRIGLPRQVAPTRDESVDAIIRRHDGRGIEAAGIDQPQPQLARRPAAAGAGEIGREVALEPFLRKRPAVAENAGRAAVDAPARVRARDRPACP